MDDKNSNGTVMILPPQNQQSLLPVQSITLQPNYPAQTQQNLCPYEGVQTMPQPVPRFPIFPYEIRQCGVSISDAQKLNYQECLNTLALEKKREEYDLKLEYEEKIQKIRNQQILPQVSSNNVNDVEQSMMERRASNMKQLVEKFIEIKSLVKVRGKGSKNSRGFFIRDEELNCHKFIEDKDLKYLLDEFIFSNVEIEEDIPQKNLDRAWGHLQFMVPFLQQSTLRTISDVQVVFLDGVYNLTTGNFTPLGDEKIFNDISIPVNWSNTINEPVIFEAFLSDIFKGDQSKMVLAYEFIGSILSSVPLPKKVYVFQGVSQAGKSRLAWIICSLFNEDDVVFLNKLSDITQDRVEKELSNCRLIYIDEASNKKILPSQASMLKTIANGCRRAKILISTNHALYTGDNGFVEQALLNRFAILPFMEPMDNVDPNVTAFEDVYLKNEKNAIIKKALQFFQGVVARGNFSHSFPVNEVVSDDEKSDNVLERLREYLTNNYEITSEIIPETTTEFIAQDVNRELPGIIKSNSVLGKRLSEIYGTELKSQHLSLGMVYNLRKISNSCVHACKKKLR